MTKTEYSLPPNESQYLQELARRMKAVSELPVMEERRKLWLNMNDGRPGARPVVVIEADTFDRDFLPKSMLQCETAYGRKLEAQFLRSIRYHEILNDDHVCPGYVQMDWHISVDEFGTDIKRTYAKDGGGDHHFVALFALEGMSDLLAALYPIEGFLMDTLDQPEEILRAVEHLSGLWLEAFADSIKLIAASGNAGGIGWAGIWAPGTTFPLQEDVAYNLSPDQFREFFVPALRRHMAAMDCPFFHLDGIGMLPHLPALLELDELPVIQWIPGAGKWEVSQWFDVIRRITGAGKSIQLYVAANEVAALVEAVGPDRLFLTIRDADHENMPRLLEQFPQEVF